MLELRLYQKECLEKLRDGFAGGKRSQVLYSPTGSGKTEMAIALLEATKTKGNRAAMILDRIILCDQTSKRLENYQIDHGVMQSGHWRYRPYEHIQVCSAQTIEKRGSFPGLSLLIVDECHAMRRQTVEFIKNNPDIRVVGLTATPFTEGIGKVYDGVVSTVTTKELVEQKVLCPLRVFIAREIETEGIKKVAGEWAQDELQKAGMKITGDVVNEWKVKSYEIFGKPEKTIVFCSGVDHGQDLAQKFAAEGFNFVPISYRDDDDYKRQVIEEFSKPDTEINGLIATDILTKGFDVPDVKIGVSARPFRKSLSSHIQQMGRVMRGHPSKEFAVWLDHSGNYIRFREEWETIFAEGVHDLNDGKEKPKKEKTKKEKEAAKCPKCGALWPGSSDTCVHCGYVRQRKSMVEAVAGYMEELQTGGNMEDKQKFWSMCRYNELYRGWSRSRCLAVYKERFGTWPRGLSDQAMTPDFKFENYMKAKLIRYLKGKGRRVAP